MPEWKTVNYWVIIFDREESFLWPLKFVETHRLFNILKKFDYRSPLTGRVKFNFLPIELSNFQRCQFFQMLKLRRTQGEFAFALALMEFQKSSKENNCFEHFSCVLRQVLYSVRLLSYQVILCFDFST